MSRDPIAQDRTGWPVRLGSRVKVERPSRVSPDSPVTFEGHVVGVTSCCERHGEILLVRDGYGHERPARPADVRLVPRRGRSLDGWRA